MMTIFPAAGNYTFQ